MEARVTKGGQGFGKVFEVLGETPVSSEPGEGALDHPTARQNAFRAGCALPHSTSAGCGGHGWSSDGRDVVDELEAARGTGRQSRPRLCAPLNQTRHLNSSKRCATSAISRRTNSLRKTGPTRRGSAR